jgi:SAM-dependent methyltransferase
VTPHLKFRATTDYTPARVGFKRRATELPAPNAQEAPGGDGGAEDSLVLVELPASAPPPEPEGEAGVLAPGARLVDVPAPPIWTDNGFASQLAMEAAHRVVLDVVDRVAGYDPSVLASVLDLGAGDGWLLRLIRAKYGATVTGVEQDLARVARGQQRGIQPDGKWPVFRLEHGKIEDAVWSTPANGAPRYDVALLMPGRLIEMNAERAAAVRARLKETAKVLVLYAYGDWTTKVGDLRQLALAAGFELRSETWKQAAGVEAAEALW